MTVVPALRDLAACTRHSIASERETSPSAAQLYARSGTQQSIPNTQWIFAGHSPEHPVVRCVPLDEAARQKMHACVLTCGNYRVRVVDSPDRCNEAGKLIKRMYSSRGYNTEAVVSLPCNPNRIMLEASSGKKLLGTLTLGLDSEEGLLADVLYKRVINPFREMGRKVCELSKFAVDPDHSSKELLASLFHLAYICARMVHKATDAFIEVNPRHSRFYERMLGFRQLGEMRICPRVGAPAVLLHIDLGYMDAQIREHSGTLDSRERSLYPYFVSGEKAEAVVGWAVQAAA